MGGLSATAILAAARAKLAAVEQRQRELDAVRCRLRQLVELCAHGDDADCVALHIGC